MLKQIHTHLFGFCRSLLAFVGILKWNDWLNGRLIMLNVQLNHGITVLQHATNENSSLSVMHNLILYLIHYYGIKALQHEYLNYSGI